MRWRRVLVSSMVLSTMVRATETDQFTTPPVPLRDIGPAVSRKIVRIIESDRSGRDPEEILARWTGNNVFASRMVRWIGRLNAGPDAITNFRPAPLRSIYRLAFSPAPASFYVDAPTVKLHGYYMGTDTIDHFLQQGYGYFRLVRHREAAGSTHAAAVAAAVRHGVKLEHGYFGTLVSGVYSNADLAANYAGMKFFLNLQNPVRIGNRTLPPLFERTPEGWRLREGIDPDRLLEPFLSNHLDESLNPSRYRFSRRAIRTAVRQRCEAWAQFYGERVELVAPASESFASTWFGEDYGHWLPASAEISIATECGSAMARAKADILFRQGTSN